MQFQKDSTLMCTLWRYCCLPSCCKPDRYLRGETTESLQHFSYLYDCLFLHTHIPIHAPQLLLTLPTMSCFVLLRYYSRLAWRIKQPCTRERPRRSEGGFMTPVMHSLRSLLFYDIIRNSTIYCTKLYCTVRYCTVRYGTVLYGFVKSAC